MCIEKEIAEYFITVSKFEYFLITKKPQIAKKEQVKNTDLTKVTGIEWSKLSKLIEEKITFNKFCFSDSGFEILKTQAPQFLVISKDEKLSWDSDEVIIDTWHRLLNRSFAQLRNNIAHGNKSHPASPFTHARTIEYIKAGYALIDFIADKIFENPEWKENIQ